MKKPQIFINKPVYLGLPILEIYEIVMYELWHDYVKPKYEEKVKGYYMDIDSFIVYIKREDIYSDIAKHCLEANQLENKKKIKENKFNFNSLRKNNKEFIKAIN